MVLLYVIDFYWFIISPLNVILILNAADPVGREVLGVGLYLLV
jgi:hypothetical protein